MRWATFAVIAIILVASLVQSHQSGEALLQWPQLVLAAFLFWIGARPRFFKMGKDGLEISDRDRDRAQKELASAAEEKGGDALDSAQGAMKAREHGLPIRILWVDDNPDGNIHEATALESLGAKIFQVTTDQAARTYLAGQDVDLIITDIRRGDDEDAGIRLLKQHAAKVKCIVYASPAGVKHRGVEALAVGARAAVATPGQLVMAVLDAARAN